MHDQAFSRKEIAGWKRVFDRLSKSLIFPVSSFREFAVRAPEKCANTGDWSSIASVWCANFQNFPDNFAVCRDCPAETSSPQTASTATQSRPEFSLCPPPTSRLKKGGFTSNRLLVAGGKSIAKMMAILPNLPTKETDIFSLSYSNC